MTHRDDAAGQLDRDLDRLASGRGHGVMPNGRSSELTIAAEALHAFNAADSTANPRPGFLAQLEDQLEMNAPGITYPVRLSARTPVQQYPERRAVPRASAGWFPAAGAAKWLATAGLLIVVALLASISFRGNGGPGNPPSVPGFAAGSPAPSPAPGGPCSGDSYVGCPGATTLIGANTAELRDVDAAALDVRQAQLQDWTVPPGVTVPGPSAPADAIRGLVVDFVIAGAYSATFDVPVVVFRHPEAIAGAVESPAAGTVVELGHGDSVAYQLGGLAELRNPLTQQPLHLKRAVFYEGDVTATYAAAGATMRVDGDGTLPQALGSFPLGSQGIALWYVQVPPGAAFPPTQWQTRAIIGPVDPEEVVSGGLLNGYVLTAGNPTG